MKINNELLRSELAKFAHTEGEYNRDVKRYTLGIETRDGFLIRREREILDLDAYYDMPPIEGDVMAEPWRGYIQQCVCRFVADNMYEISTDIERAKNDILYIHRSPVAGLDNRFAWVDAGRLLISLLDVEPLEYKPDLQKKAILEQPGVVRELTDDERKEYITILEEEKAKRIKEIDDFLDMHGFSMINSWQFWVDEKTIKNYL